MKQNFWEEYEDEEWQYEDGILDDIEQGGEGWEEKEAYEQEEEEGHI